MKLAVSNIAWDESELASHLTLLKDLNCDGVELAPSCIWGEPTTATQNERVRIKNLIADAGLDLVGFHALFYTRPDLQLFLDEHSRDAVVEYLKLLVGLCEDLGGGVLVCGSPKNRLRHGRTRRECLSWAADVFHSVVTDAAGLGVRVAIEPLPQQETEFIVSGDEGMELVRLVGHPNFGLHLDAKAMIEGGEDVDRVLSAYGRHIYHFHVGDPGLAPPGSTGCDHTQIGEALNRSGYTGYVSIEMRRGFGQTTDVITRSVDYVRSCYFL